MPRAARSAKPMADAASVALGREVMLARTALGLTRAASARLACVSPNTVRRIEEGDAHVALLTVCRVADALGMRVWMRAFPIRTPALRDTGQLGIADWIRQRADDSYQVVQELSLGNGRAIDTVLLGATEIVAIEIERLLADLQSQYRWADAKRNELADRHERPVRLVMVVEDTRRNRAVAREHRALIESMLPAGSREILRSLRTGQPLGRDGLLWVRPQRTDRR